MSEEKLTREQEAIIEARRDMTDLKSRMLELEAISRKARTMTAILSLLVVAGFAGVTIILFNVGIVS